MVTRRVWHSTRSPIEPRLVRVWKTMFTTVYPSSSCGLPGDWLHVYKYTTINTSLHAAIFCVSLVVPPAAWCELYDHSLVVFVLLRFNNRLFVYGHIVLCVCLEYKLLHVCYYHAGQELTAEFHYNGTTRLKCSTTILNKKNIFTIHLTERLKQLALPYGRYKCRIHDHMY